MRLTHEDALRIWEALEVLSVHASGEQCIRVRRVVELTDPARPTRDLK